MRIRLFGALTTLTVAAGSLVAADFWEKKKYSEWKTSEVEKMMTDSPWCKSVQVPLKLPAGTFKPGMAPPPTGGMESSGGSMGTRLLVRWRSAMPVRQAVAQFALLQKLANANQSVESLGTTMQYYIVEIDGMPTSAVDLPPEELKTHAELRIKDLPPIQPARVTLEKGRGPTTGIYLLFPREQEGGHQIVASDTEVEVFLQLDAGKVSKKFKLKDMEFDGKLEL